MPESDLTQLRDPETSAELRILLTGLKFDLANKENVALLKRRGVRKVFTLFPIRQKQLEHRATMGEFGISTGQALTLEKFYAKMHIDPFFVTQLQQNGIQVSSLARNPTSFRHYESFDREARQVKGRFLIQCIHGKHASAAYAMYFLANSTHYSAQEIHSILQKAGLTATDVSRATDFLKDAKVDLAKLVERKDQQLRHKYRQEIAIVKAVSRHVLKGEKSSAVKRLLGETQKNGQVKLKVQRHH
jgi:hypothetical protein